MERHNKLMLIMIIALFVYAGNHLFFYFYKTENEVLCATISSTIDAITLPVQLWVCWGLSRPPRRTVNQINVMLFVGQPEDEEDLPPMHR